MEKRFVALFICTANLIVATVFATLFLLHKLDEKNHTTNSRNSTLHRNSESTANITRASSDKADLIKQRTNCITNGCGHIDYGNRVLNGEPIGLDDYPWMALIANKIKNISMFVCAGSLISERFVLTAAHCFMKPNHNIHFVRLGEYNISTERDCVSHISGEEDCAPPHQDLLIDEAIPHPSFKMGEFHDDIGLLKLQTTPLINERVKTICLPSPDDFATHVKPDIFVVGWGLTEKGRTSDVAMTAGLHIKQFEICRRKYRLSSDTVTTGQICVGDAVANTCKGDSGGPLQFILQRSHDQMRFYQYGVISAGAQGLCTALLPTMHIVLEPYIEWIHNIIQIID